MEEKYAILNPSLKREEYSPLPLVGKRLGGQHQETMKKVAINVNLF